MSRAKEPLMTLATFLVLTLSLALAAPSAEAQDMKDFNRIVRLSYVEGHVSFQHSSDVDWTAASVNLALQTGDRIYTGEDGRAEIEFDDGSVLRLAEKTDVEILSLKDDFIQLRILLGLSTLTVGSSIAFEINTPAAAFNTLRKGVYRFDVHENGDSDGIVRKGLMEAANNSFTERLDSEELVHVSPGDQDKHVLSRYTDRDDWDEWTDRRIADAVAYDSRKYLPDYVHPGVRELDRHGRWTVIDEYGPAWVPQYVAPGWTPYLDGRWCYRPNWGWTWVSYEPWGWLPYHYGRWFHSISSGWCWIPGPSFGFHFWSPGLVRFYQGPTWVSWCPLGPGDYYNVNNFFYNPAYRYRLNQLRLIQRRGPDDLSNRHVPGAFQTLRTEQFTNGARALSARTLQAEGFERPWQQGRLIAGQPEVRPTAQSYAPVPERAAFRPPVDGSRPVVVRTEPPAVTGGPNRYARIVTRAPIPLIRGLERNGAPQTDGGRRAPFSGTPGEASASPRPGADLESRSSGTSSIGNRRAVNSPDQSERSGGRNYRAQPGIDGQDRRQLREPPGAPEASPWVTQPGTSSESRRSYRARELPGSRPDYGSAQPSEIPIPHAPRYERSAPEITPRDMNRGRPESRARQPEPGTPRNFGQARTRGGDGSPSSSAGSAPAHIPRGSMGTMRPSAPPPAARGESRGGGSPRRRDQ
jgi:Family of unknown function (DUF6600)/FecR protein